MPIKVITMEDSQAFMIKEDEKANLACLCEFNIYNN
jgi:hypothetical protein